jgi:hypothetical protein
MVRAESGLRLSAGQRLFSTATFNLANFQHLVDKCPVACPSTHVCTDTGPGTRGELPQPHRVDTSRFATRASPSTGAVPAIRNAQGKNDHAACGALSQLGQTREAGAIACMGAETCPCEGPAAQVNLRR